MATAAAAAARVIEFAVIAQDSGRVVYLNLVDARVGSLQFLLQAGSVLEHISDAALKTLAGDPGTALSNLTTVGTGLGSLVLFAMSHSVGRAALRKQADQLAKALDDNLRLQHALTALYAALKAVDHVQLEGNWGTNIRISRESMRDLMSILPAVRTTETRLVGILDGRLDRRGTHATIEILLEGQDRQAIVPPGPFYDLLDAQASRWNGRQILADLTFDPVTRYLEIGEVHAWRRSIDRQFKPLPPTVKVREPS